MKMENMWPKSDPASMNSFYGCPDMNGDGRPDADWERNNIVYLTPPYPMVLAWNTEKAVTRIAIHRKCYDALHRALLMIGNEFSRDEILKHHLDRYGGAYMFRTMRGSHKLSMHSWGCAIDLAPELNPLGREYAFRPNMMPLRAVEIFRACGAEWGGLWHRPDGMHFQFART